MEPSASVGRDPDADHLEALRRRVYAPGASPEDVDRYRDLVARSPDPVGEPESESAPESGSAPEPRRRPLLVGVAAIAVAGLVATGVAVTVRPQPTRHTAPKPTTASVEDTRLAVSTLQRRAFTTALRRNASADVVGFIAAHPAAVPASVRATRWSDAGEVHDTGPSALTLFPSSDQRRGGRMTVALTVDRDTTASVAIDDGEGEPLSSVTITARAGVPEVRTLPYPGAAPSWIELDLPGDVRWDLVLR